MSSAESGQHPRVVNVAAGVETTARPVPLRDARHEALEVFIGKWINEGHTVATSEVPSTPILTSDAYDWAPGGFFVIHTAYGKIGDTSVGGVEVIGVDGDAYRSTFYDSFGNAHVARRDRRRCHQVVRGPHTMRRDRGGRRFDAGSPPRGHDRRRHMGTLNGRHA
jgi:hypothetical protein